MRRRGWGKKGGRCGCRYPDDDPANVLQVFQFHARAASLGKRRAVRAEHGAVKSEEGGGRENKSQVRRGRAVCV
eukprot:2874234-Rhodomonas_salina.2